MKNYHRQLYNDEKARIAAKRAEDGVQITVESKMSEARRKEITRALAVMCCIDKEAFSIVEREVRAFRWL